MRLVAFSRPPALVVALRRGLFAAEGIDLSFTRTASSRDQLDALLRGEHDVAHTAADNIVARVDAGADLAVVLIADRGVEHDLVGASTIRALGDLTGRRLGVDAPESGHAILAYVVLAEAGIARGRYQIVPVGSTRDRYAALLDGRIDAAMLNSPHKERAVAAGCHVLADVPARFPEHPGLTVAVRRAWAGEHGDEVAAYCRALIAGTRIVADPSERARVIEDLAADEGIARDAAAARYDAERRSGLPTIAEMERSIIAVCTARRVAGLASGPIEPSRYFDPAYVRAALAAAR